MACVALPAGDGRGGGAALSGAVEPGRRTLAGPGEGWVEARRSRFYAYACPLPPQPAEAAEALRGFLAAVRVARREARHVVFAWRDGRGEGRGSDDGEPHGTGLRPCLAALGGLDAATVAVARIFGGVLLGPAGLARAYGAAAAAAVSAAGLREVVPLFPFTVEVPLAAAPSAEGALRRLRAEGMERSYRAGEACLRGRVGAALAQRLSAELAAATGGRARVSVAAEPAWF